MIQRIQASFFPHQFAALWKLLLSNICQKNQLLATLVQFAAHATVFTGRPLSFLVESSLSFTWKGLTMTWKRSVTLCVVILMPWKFPPRAEMKVVVIFPCQSTWWCPLFLQLPTVCYHQSLGVTVLWSLLVLHQRFQNKPMAFVWRWSCEVCPTLQIE